MELTSYLDSVRAGVQNAAALADDHTKHVAEQLGAALESSSRLALLQALSDATGEISTELAPGSVEVRMSGADPTFVVNLPSVGHDDVTRLVPESADEQADPTTDPLGGDGDELQARISLRLPQSVKDKVDEFASADGVSTNTWLLHRIAEALADRSGPGRRRGWGIDIGHEGVRFNMPDPPTPPHPPAFRMGLPPFGDRGARSERDRQDRGRGEGGGRGTVQGWVR